MYFMERDFFNGIFPSNFLQNNSAAAVLLLIIKSESQIKIQKRSFITTRRACCAT